MSDDVMVMSHVLYAARQARRFAPRNEAMYTAAAAPEDLSRHRADVSLLSCFRTTAVLVRGVERKGLEGAVNPGPAMIEVIHDAADGTITDRSG